MRVTICGACVYVHVFFLQAPIKHCASLPHKSSMRKFICRSTEAVWPRVKTCHIPLRAGWSVMYSARPAVLYYISPFVSFSLCYNLTRLCPSWQALEDGSKRNGGAGRERLACDRQPIFHNYWYSVDSLRNHRKDTVASDNILLQKLTFLGHSRLAWDCG